MIIINYGIGNLSSIANMLKKIGITAKISSDKNEIINSNKIILPGVGNFEHCMQMFNNSGLRPIIEQKALHDKIPLLGICVGHQMLFESSEEGNVAGLGWIPGKVVKFTPDFLPENYKIPHMGWADIQITNQNNLFNDIEEPRYYFVHSYHVVCDPVYTIATSNYGYEFNAAVQYHNIFGVQFHPEKSHSFGMKLFKNFSINY